VPVAVAGRADRAGFVELAAEVERWFGPMVGEPGFHRDTAVCVRRDGGTGLRGGTPLSVRPRRCRIGWLVVADADRGRGVGRALVAEAVRRLDGPGVVEVVTFGADHPAAEPSGARAFYERLGFTAEETADAALSAYVPGGTLSATRPTRVR
jgi:GNAT superfamily N-acetyltransferase